MNLKPERISLDPIRTAEIIYQGGRLYEQEEGEEPTLKQIIWRLIQEAVECDRALAAPRPRVKSRSGPEVFYTRAEIFGTEVEWAADGISYPPEIRTRPTAEALKRYHDVMGWLRFVRGRSKSRKLLVQMLVALAAGMTPTKAADAFPALNYRNGQAVWAARHRALMSIEGRVREACERLDISA